MKSQIEDIVMKYPKTLISAVASSDPAIKTSMKGMASALTICADHISSAIA
ncbi:hypothetical protein [Herbaspirillum sp. VT-16-41]|uniref:hypothetical protein n=1 Tax=Herbaspirillum sp. VT-16-41 TaxID=1953765 RepID=UPI00143DA1AD|nr:hypothetical protein [Herbaspirillum sp. VT-16-41]